MTNILAFDPSGNYGNEGMGVTGYCTMKDGEPKVLGEIKASNYKSEVEYWSVHQNLIETHFPDEIVIEGYRLYNNKKIKAETQANSELQTSQLIGAIKLVAYRMDIPLKVQFATEVKTRWSEQVLVAKGYLTEVNGRYLFNGHQTNNHKRDALKHAMQYWRYGRKKK